MTEGQQERETQPTKTSEPSGSESQKASVKRGKTKDFKDSHPPPTGSFPRTDKKLVKVYMKGAKKDRVRCQS